MVAVTKRGVVRNLRRVSPQGNASFAATIALPGSRRLEDYPQVGRKKVYVIDGAMWDYLLSKGWRVQSIEYRAAHRLVDSADGFELYEVGFFSRDAVLERRRHYGTREYVDVVRVRIPWSDGIEGDGWAWLHVDEDED